MSKLRAAPESELGRFRPRPAEGRASRQALAGGIARAGLPLLVLVILPILVNQAFARGLETPSTIVMLLPGILLLGAPFLSRIGFSRLKGLGIASAYGASITGVLAGAILLVGWDPGNLPSAVVVASFLACATGVAIAGVGLPGFIPPARSPGTAAPAGVAWGLLILGLALVTLFAGNAGLPWLVFASAGTFLVLPFRFFPPFLPSTDEGGDAPNSDPDSGPNSGPNSRPNSRPDSTLVGQSATNSSIALPFCLVAALVTFAVNRGAAAPWTWILVGAGGSLLAWGAWPALQASSRWIGQTGTAVGFLVLAFDAALLVTPPMLVQLGFTWGILLVAWIGHLGSISHERADLARGLTGLAGLLEVGAVVLGREMASWVRDGNPTLLLVVGVVLAGILGILVTWALQREWHDPQTPGIGSTKDTGVQVTGRSRKKREGPR